MDDAVFKKSFIVYVSRQNISSNGKLINTCYYRFHYNAMVLGNNFDTLYIGLSVIAQWACVRQSKFICGDYNVRHWNYVTIITKGIMYRTRAKALQLKFKNYFFEPIERLLFKKSFFCHLSPIKTSARAKVIGNQVLK